MALLPGDGGGEALPKRQPRWQPLWEKQKGQATEEEGTEPAACGVTVRCGARKRAVGCRRGERDALPGLRVCLGDATRRGLDGGEDSKIGTMMVFKTDINRLIN
jgi:hypothetical protein